MTIETPIADVFAAVCDAHHDRVALVDGDIEITYGELSRQVRDRAAALPGLTPRDVVVLAAPPSVDFIISYFALRALGVPLVCAPPAQSAAFDVVRPNATLDDRGFRHDRSDPPAWTSDEPTVSTVLFTSGTTADPKAVAHSDVSLLWGAFNTVSLNDELLAGGVTVPESDDAMIADLARRAGDEPLGLLFCTGLPIWTISGLTIAHRALLSGDALAVTPRFDVGSFARLASERSVTFSLAPPMLRVLVAHAVSQREAGDWSGRAVAVSVGGGKADPRLMFEAAELFGCTTRIGYGSTESGGVVLSTRPLDDVEVRNTTLGRPVAAVDVEIRTSKGHSSLWCRTPAAMVGYLRDDGLDRPGEWLDLGDAVQELPDGNFRFAGRADSLILRGAKLIDPVAVEQVLESHDAIDRAAVIGVANDRSGEPDLIALVTVPAGALAPTPSELRQSCLDAGTAFPQVIRYVDELPLTADGAPRRGELHGLVIHQSLGTSALEASGP